MTNEKDISDEELMAFADGELPDSESDRIERSIAGSVELSNRLRALSSSRDTLRNELLKRTVEPTTAKLKSLVSSLERKENGGADIISLQDRKTRRGAAPRLWYAIAASLIVGIGIGLSGNLFTAERPSAGRDKVSLSHPVEREKILSDRSIETLLKDAGIGPGKPSFQTLSSIIRERGPTNLTVDSRTTIVVEEASQADCLDFQLNVDQASIDQFTICVDSDGKLAIR